MINWSLTKAKFGINSLSGYRPKVICKCDKCDKVKEITIRVKSKIVNGQMPWECPKCVGNRKEVKEKLKESTKKSWENEDYKQKQIEKSRKLANDHGFRNKISYSAKEYWINNNKLKEELSKKYLNLYSKTNYKEIRKQQSIKLWQDNKFRKKVLSAYTPEWRARHSKIMKIVRNNSKTKEKLAIARIKQPRISSQQRILYSILSDLKIDYKIEHRIGYYAFDCFIPEHNLLIEVQGEYWHSLPKAKQNDKAKATYIERYFPQYHLKYLNERDFLFHNKVVNIILEWIGLIDYNLIDFKFSDLQVIKIDRQLAKDFINKYHYLSTLGNGKYIYGTLLGNDLLAVAVFNKPTRYESQKRLKSSVMELTRFCIHPNRHKKNFATWFMSRAEKLLIEDSDFETLLAFADPINDNIGTIYKANNWLSDGMTASSYYYADNDGYIMHKKTLYNHAIKMKMREKEYAKKYGYTKIKVGPKFRFKKHIK